MVAHRLVVDETDERSVSFAGPVGVPVDAWNGFPRMIEPRRAPEPPMLLWNEPIGPPGRRKGYPVGPVPDFTQPGVTTPDAQDL